MAHGRAEAFDQNDVRLMNMLADFVAMGFKQQKQHGLLIAQARATAAAQMAHELAHQINNPLQSMMNAAFLVAEGDSKQDSKTMGRELENDIHRLSDLVQKLLALPFQTNDARES